MSTYDCRRFHSLGTPRFFLTMVMAGLFLPAHVALTADGLSAASSGGSGGHVSGSIVAEVEGQRQIALPNITVYAKNLGTSARSPKVLTDLEGRFIIPIRPAGTYELCWEAQGFRSGCSPKTFSRDQAAVVLQPIKVVPEGNSIFGQVTLADGSPCRQFDPFFGLNVSTTVALVDSTGHEAATPVFASITGDYLVPNIPAGTVSVRAGCEAAVAETTVTSDASKAVDLTFQSQNPTVTELVAILNGQSVEGVPPGATVEVGASANDPEGNLLHYKWVTMTPGFTASDAPTVQWTLPESPGLHRLYVVVSNGKGGYQIGRMEISTDDGIIPATAQDTRNNLLSSPALQLERAFALRAQATRTIPSDPHSFLTKKGVDDPSTAEAYYKAIDPLDQKTTFKKWKRRNGFRVNPDANRDGNAFNDDRKIKEESAVYLNAVDLHLGRAMHAKKRKDGLAYYVCNHPTANDAVRGKKLIACVAMEYSVVPGVNGNQAFTKFYVYDNIGKRIPSADLDGRGEKYVPGLCMACHGGTHANGQSFQTGDNPNVAAQFLPFDLDNFEFANRRRFKRPDQEGKFRGLNKIVKATAPLTAITQLIDGWYPGGIGKQFSAFLPPEWDPLATPPVPASAADLYREVVKTSCRTCHVALSDNLDWAQFSEFDAFSPTIRADVCRDRIMPQALVTFNRFWLSEDPFRVEVLRLAGLSGWPSTAECPCGGPGEPSCVVAPANVPPVAKPDSATTVVDSPVLINVVRNDTDANGNGTLDPASVAIVGDPTNGTALPDGSGAVTYRPTAGFSGRDSFTYTVKDSQGATSNEATVTVTVIDPAGNPVAVDDTFSTNENTPLTGTSVLANDSGANLTAVLNSGPSNAASFTLTADGRFSYTPNAGFFGTDSFTYHANDGTADSNVATVTITVNKVAQFTRDVQPIFTANCISCHGGNLAPDLRAGSAFGAIVSVQATCNTTLFRVVPSNAGSSVLMQRMDNTGAGSCAGPMPTGGVLNLPMRDIVRSWINNGALNN